MMRRKPLIWKRATMTQEVATVERKVTAYAETFLLSYATTLMANFGAVGRRLETIGQQSRMFPLLGRRIGYDTSLAILSSDSDFYLFFTEDTGVTLKLWRHVGAADRFDRDWTLSTPHRIREQKVREFLALDEQEILGLVNLAGLWNFIEYTEEAMVREAKGHGVDLANAHGSVAEKQLPALAAAFDQAQARAGLCDSYRALLEWSESPQTRGIAFEKLWHDLLEFHGWHPKKITIAGEDDDFTAIRNGAHILGEVRWYTKPMTGGKAREFLAKLDPRPATIGLFVSFSGFDGGARAVFRRAINTKAVVLFGRPEIDKILLAGADPGSLFDERLREVYDYLFESPPTS